jgi:hypothetical protein
MREDFIPVEEVAKKWINRPGFVAVYDALGEKY